MKLLKQDWFSFLNKPNTICLWTGNMALTSSGNAVMGAGLAKELSTRYPRIKSTLASIMKTDPVVINTLPDPYGNMTRIIRPRIMMASKNIWMFPVKYGWWEKADLKLIRHSCRTLNSYASSKQHLQFVLNFPGIGAGGLEYSQVLPVIQEELISDNITVVIKSNKKEDTKMTKQEGLKIAAEYGLEWEFEFSYTQGLDMGMTEEAATEFALNEWDI